MKYSMKEKLQLPIYWCKWIWRGKISRKIKKKLHIRYKPVIKRFGRNFSDVNSVQTRIAEMILSGRPMMVGRMGGVESCVVPDAVRADILNTELKKANTKRIYNNAGFFPPTRENLIKYSDLIQDCFKQVDILATMSMNNDEFLIRNRLGKDTMVTELGHLEPYYSDIPWSKALKGKKVLVIHPFAESIKSQYEKRELLFENKDILPEFELKTIKAVQSIAGTKTEFSDWFEALDYMYEEAMKLDFDVAIIGCGAYGFPLAAMLKKAGKQAIHLAGATQILFGVWGSRWENFKVIKALKNENWVRPSLAETPDGAGKVEGACYW